MKRYDVVFCNKYGEPVDPLKVNVGLKQVEDAQGKYVEYGEYVEFMEMTVRGMLKLLDMCVVKQRNY